jgi:hypothetical protein
MKKYLLVVMLAFMTAAACAENVEVTHFLVMPSFNGESGFIYAPSAYVPPGNTFTLGLHMFVFKANYSFLDIFETGINLDFTNTSNVLEILKAGDINIKGRVLREEDFFVSVAAGLEKLPANFTRKMTGQDFSWYAVVSKKLDDMDISMGMRKNVTGLYQANYFMADFSKVISETVLYIAEYNCGDLNTGIKISLNSNINVELFLSGLQDIGKTNALGTFLRQNFIFGITYIQ